MRALIDTCIIVDALQSRQPFCAEAQEIFLATANKRFSGFITAKSATDIYYLTHRYTHNDKDTRTILNTLFGLFVYLILLVWTAGVPFLRIFLILKMRLW